MQRYIDTCNWPRKVMFGPAPVTTATEVKKAMLEDHGLTESGIYRLCDKIKQQMLEVAGLSEKEYYPIFLQGSTTFIIEAVVNRASPPNGKWLVLVNGHFSLHTQDIIRYSKKNYYTLRFPETESIDPKKVEEHLQTNKDYTAVSILHLETSTGCLNDIRSIGKIVKKYLPDAFYVVDGATSFGGVPIDMTNIDFLIGCPNKAIEGVPGIGVAYAKRTAIEKTEGNRYSFALDLGAQIAHVNKNTMPFEVLSAFSKALELLIQEGGVEARAKRYKRINQTIRHGMKELGFEEYVKNKDSSHIINAYKFPFPDFNLSYFADRLENYGIVIYRIMLTKESSTLRLGNMGQLTDNDIQDLFSNIKAVLKEMGCTLPFPKQK